MTIANQADHIDRGDNHDLTNLQAACTNCHAAKTAAEGNAAKPQRRRPTREQHPGTTGGDTP